MRLEVENMKHAYLLAGDTETALALAQKAAEDLLGRVELLSHPDFFYQKVEIFGIKDSQEVKRKTSTKPFLGEKKVFILETLALTIEAENALLKVMEEPPRGTHFL